RRRRDRLSRRRGGVRRRAAYPEDAEEYGATHLIEDTCARVETLREAMAAMAAMAVRGAT
ncbi:MAG TPA: hypothetical protein VIF62_04535, partial [Labilithrix sp.]